jgi:hypothetical protein
MPPSPLPEGWSEPAFQEDVVVADGVEIGRSGVSSVGPNGEEATGSAAETGGVPRSRSYHELLERVSLMEAIREERARRELRGLDGRLLGERASADVFPESDAPERWRYARSNGVAIHADWQSACRRAYWELVERDRVLRSWYGEVRPSRRHLGPAGGVFEKASSYEWRAYEFPAGDAAFGEEVAVAGVFGFPSRRQVPLVLGFGARPHIEDAIAAASAEATQLLAFLWGEPLPDDVSAIGPTPMHHLEQNLHPARAATLRAWLEGEHVRYGDERARRGGRAAASETVFVDLTPAWLGGGLRVVKAIHSAAEPLAFGDSPFGAHLPLHLRSHPIA